MNPNTLRSIDRAIRSTVATVLSLGVIGCAPEGSLSILPIEPKAQVRTIGECYLVSNEMIGEVNWKTGKDGSSLHTLPGLAGKNGAIYENVQIATDNGELPAGISEVSCPPNQSSQATTLNLDASESVTVDTGGFAEQAIIWDEDTSIQRLPGLAGKNTVIYRGPTITLDQDGNIPSGISLNQ